MEGLSLFTNSQPQGGVTDNFRQYIKETIEEILIEGRGFDGHKRWLRRFSDSEGVDCNTLERNMSDMIEVLKEWKQLKSKSSERLARMIGMECFLTEQNIDDLFQELDGRTIQISQVANATNDASIIGSSQNSAADTEYINECIKEVCINSDSLSKYQKIIEKKYGIEFYHKCEGFVDETKRSVVMKKFTNTSVANLHLLARQIEVSDAVVDIIVKHFNDKFETDEAMMESMELSCICKNGAYGYVDENGNMVIRCQWKDAEDFSEGLARVLNNDGKWGYIDKTGREVIPFKWDDACDFSEGMAWVTKNGEEWGCIDKKGREVSQFIWYAPEDFSEGLAFAINEDDECCFIDKTGNVMISCMWDYAGSFHEGLAIVENSDGKRGFIDKVGKLVIPCQWEYVGSFYEGLAMVENNDGKKGLIDKLGKMVVPCQWDAIHGRFSEGLLAVKKDDRWGFIDKSGKIVIPFQWVQASSFSEELASVRGIGTTGYIDKTGRLVLEVRWDIAGDFHEGLAYVGVGDGFIGHRYGYIDRSGNLVIPIQWEDAGFFSGGYARVKDNNGIWRRIDKAGNYCNRNNYFPRHLQY